uniref:Alpha/beta hydrolase fold-3 domain-containing protein n=1 Tax=Chromera velia CCMP2878 TaxID=1169474 RepID=A0A0G4G5P5_9ALVE|eukprot:Cvel_20341.t1-p1 / transcript=Cvel_20341.t1 / gene=Cvel_20341 / organism=Chromera_velia_CCMP2878 / gene_product=hypothetical protein / transcript_product=hypothetical protein / location=Cvel_scaffold1818:16264-17751(+) / protein_length=496 / sequence_SO=supercontig / SO=protein_coding / is_pseudo=false
MRCTQEPDPDKPSEGVASTTGSAEAGPEFLLTRSSQSRPLISFKNVFALAASLAAFATVLALVLPYPVIFYGVRAAHSLLIWRLFLFGTPGWMEGRHHEEMSWEFRALSVMLFWQDSIDYPFSHPRGFEVMRKEVDRMATLVPLHKQAKVQLVDAGGFPAALVDVRAVAEPSEREKLSEGTLVYFHGGGFSMGSMGGYLGVGTQMAISFGVTHALVPDYPRIPEAGGLGDVVDGAFVSYLWLLRQLDEARRKSTKIICAGESAGASLCLYILLQARKHEEETGEKLRLPDAVILLSPWVWPGLHSSAPSLSKFKDTDAFCRPRVSKWIMKTFAEAHPGLLAERGNPEGAQISSHSQQISHHFPSLPADLQPFNLLAAVAEGRLGPDLPPTFVSVGGGELLLDMGLEFARLLGIPSALVTRSDFVSSGVSPTSDGKASSEIEAEDQIRPCLEGERGDCLSVVPHMPHVFQCFPSFVKEAREELLRIRTWLRGLGLSE